MTWLSAILKWFSDLFSQVSAPAVPKVPKDPTPGTVIPLPQKRMPWMDWMRARLGWTEFSHDFELSKFWKYTDCPEFKTVIGKDHAWCAMFLCAALEETGYQSPRNASAIAFKKFGKEINWRLVGIPEGAIVVIEHKDGGHHVTTANRSHGAGDMILEGLGGNQGNQVCVKKFSLLDEKILWVGMPV